MAMTAKQIREDLKAKRLTVNALAKKHGFPDHVVRAVVYGRSKGNYGLAHTVAVALGIKDSPK